MTEGLSDSGKNSTLAPLIEPHFCIRILYEQVSPGVNIRIQDVALLVPSLLFFLFLLFSFKSVYGRMRTNNSAIVVAFYFLVCIVSAISIIRCIVSMSVNAAVAVGDLVDKILWLILRFSLLVSEMSIVVFCLGAARLDSQLGVRRVVLVTVMIAFAYSVVQFVLELTRTSDKFVVKAKNYDLYSHGGMLFLFISSALFTVVYAAICILPFLKIGSRFPLPTKKSFYIYCGILTILNACQAVGSMLYYCNLIAGLCIVDLTTYIYFSLFDIFVYIVFLRKYFTPDKGIFSFLYSKHYEEEATQVNLYVNNDLNVNSIDKTHTNEAADTTDVWPDEITQPAYTPSGELTFRFDYYSSSPTNIVNLEDSGRFSTG